MRLAPDHHVPPRLGPLPVPRGRLDRVERATAARVARRARRHLGPVDAPSRRVGNGAGAQSLGDLRARRAGGLRGRRLRSGRRRAIPQGLNRLGCIEVAGARIIGWLRRHPRGPLPLDIQEIQGPLRVLAGPGTGKTHTLVDLYEQAVRTRVADRSQILVLTFSTGAAGELASRIDARLNDDYGEAWISTFHSFCMRLLRQHQPDPKRLLLDGYQEV